MIIHSGHIFETKLLAPEFTPLTQAAAIRQPCHFPHCASNGREGSQLSIDGSALELMQDIAMLILIAVKTAIECWTGKYIPK